MGDASLQACAKIDDVRHLAERRTPRPLFDYIAAGTGEEETAQLNCDAFRNFEILPRVARNVSEVDMSTTFLGQTSALPLVIAPTGGLGLVYRGAEIAVARAASDAGLLFSLSCLSTIPLEEVAKATEGPKIFQFYALTDREYTKTMIKRAKDAGYFALCLTVDVQDTPPRPSSNRWGNPFGNTIPIGTALAMARHPFRTLQFKKTQMSGLIAIMDELAAQGSEFGIRNDLTWADVAEFVRLWDGPFLVKGILRSEDAASAREAGATAIVICNHGGNALDGAAAPVDVTEEVSGSLTPSISVVECGGIRRGSDILKSLALGASMTMTGRPFMYGAAAAGEEGVRKVIDIFRDQFLSTMKLAGCRNIGEIDKTMVRRRVPSHSVGH